MQLSCYEKIAEHFFLILLIEYLLALPSMVALAPRDHVLLRQGNGKGGVLCTRVGASAQTSR